MIPVPGAGAEQSVKLVHQDPEQAVTEGTCIRQRDRQAQNENCALVFPLVSLVVYAVWCNDRL